MDFDDRTGLIAVSSLESEGSVDLFDLALAQHRFALPPRGALDTDLILNIRI